MSTLKITFNNTSSLPDTQVSFGFVSGSATAAFSITNLMDSSAVLPLNETVGSGNWYTLSDLCAGVAITNFSGRIYASYGQTWDVLSVGYEPAQNITDANFFLRYDKMELTFNGSPDDVADLTSIDYWSIPMNLETFLNGVSVQTDNGITGGFTIQDVFNELNTLTTPPVSGLSGALPALVPGGFTQNSNQPGSGFARIIGPSSYPVIGGVPITPYDLFENYLNFLLTNFGPGTSVGAVLPGLGNGVIATISGQFNGVGPNVPSSGPKSAQSYDLTATIDSSSNITLTGTVGSVSGTTTMFFKNGDLINPSGIYGANAFFSLNGDTAEEPINNVYGWICGDLFSGLNIGAFGSSINIGGTEVGAMPSSQWFSIANTDLFQNLQPNNPANYNHYAATLQAFSQAYNFAYSDRFAPVLVSLNPATVDTLQITLLPENVTMTSGATNLAVGSKSPAPKQ